MKPSTVFWIAYCSAVLMLDLAVWLYKGNTWGLFWAIVVSLALASWIWRGIKENRLRKDMKALIDDMAKQLINHGGLYMEYKPNLVKPFTKENE